MTAGAKRVLLVCPERLGHGQPAGIGIRFLEIARVLLADGHEVTMLSRDGGAVEGCRVDTISPQTIHDHSGRCDVALMQGHVANDLFAHARPIPMVVDLYDPFIIENLSYFHERGGEVFHHDHLTLMNSIANGDLFLCASESQRLFYLGLLLAAGRVNPVTFEADPRFERLVRIAPFGVQPERPPLPRDLARPKVFFGGIYDWYDPVLAIEAVSIARETMPEMTLTFTRHPNPDITPQGKLAEAMQHAKKHHYPFVKFEPWIGYDRRGEFFEQFTVALLTFPQSIETDLSMRTRIYDQLWGGLPTVTSSAPGTDEMLTRYGAGTIVHHNDPREFARELLGVLRNRERYEAMARGARAFVRDHQWPSTLAPLREFVRDPRIDETKHAFAKKHEVAPARPLTLAQRIRRRVLRRFGAST